MTIEIDHSDSQEIIKAISDLQDTFKKLSTDKKTSKATLKFYSSKTEEHLFDVIFDSPEEASGYMNKPSTWYTSKTTKSGNDFIKAYYEPNSKKYFESEFDRDSFPDTKNNLKAKLKIYDFDTGKFLGDHTFENAQEANNFVHKSNRWYQSTVNHRKMNYAPVYKKETPKGDKYYSKIDRNRMVARTASSGRFINSGKQSTLLRGIPSKVNILDGRTSKLIETKTFPSKAEASYYFNRNKEWYKGRLKNIRKYNPKADSIDVFKVGDQYYSSLRVAQKHLNINPDFEITE